MASPTKAAATVERAANFRGPMLAAAAILLVFFGGFGTWAVLVPLSGAAIAPAVVAPEGSARRSSISKVGSSRRSASRKAAKSRPAT